jgi:hypothetical protein
MAQPASDPLEAFQNVFNGTPALVAAYPGGCWTGRVQPKESLPYLSVMFVASATNLLTNDASYEQARYQFSSFAKTAAQATNLGKLLASVLKTAVITFTGGMVSGKLIPLPRSGLIEDPHYTRDGSNCWQDFRIYLLHINPRGS